MRTTIYSLTILTLALTLTACGSGWTDGWYVGSENGQRMGDDSWEHDPIFHKPGALVLFPLSDEGPFVAAGQENVAFQPGQPHILVARGTLVSDVTLLPTGELQQYGESLGFVVYVQRDDGTLGTAMISNAGRTLELSFDGAAPQLIETDALLDLAGADRAPLDEAGLPIAQPAN